MRTVVSLFVAIFLGLFICGKSYSNEPQLITKKAKSSAVNCSKLDEYVTNLYSKAINQRKDLALIEHRIKLIGSLGGDQEKKEKNINIIKYLLEKYKYHREEYKEKCESPSKKLIIFKKNNQNYLIPAFEEIG